MRACLSKLNNRHPSHPSNIFGPVFIRGTPPALTSQEVRVRQQLLHGDMPERKARSVLATMQDKRVWSTRLQVIEALAAISSRYRAEVVRRSEKKGTFVYHHLCVATSAERLERLFNNHRARAGVLLPSGATSNEAFRAELRIFF